VQQKGEVNTCSIIWHITVKNVWTLDELKWPDQKWRCLIITWYNWSVAANASHIFILHCSRDITSCSHTVCDLEQSFNLVMSVKVIAQTIVYSSVNTPRLIHLYAIYSVKHLIYTGVTLLKWLSMPLKVIGMTINATLAMAFFKCSKSHTTCCVSSTVTVSPLNSFYCIWNKPTTTFMTTKPWTLSWFKYNIWLPVDVL